MRPPRRPSNPKTSAVPSPVDQRSQDIDLSFTFCSYAANRCRVDCMIDILADNLLPLAAAIVIVLAGLAAVVALVVLAVRAVRQRDRDAADAQMAELARLQAETAVRIEGMRDMLAGRQAELHRAVNERLGSGNHHLRQSMTTTRPHTVDSPQKPNEPPPGIDSAAKNNTQPYTRGTP